MKNFREKIEKLHADAEDCALIGMLATDKKKREMFSLLGKRLHQTALELEKIATVSDPLNLGKRKTSPPVE